jgi:hypothetical protein
LNQAMQRALASPAPQSEAPPRARGARAHGLNFADFHAGKTCPSLRTFAKIGLETSLIVTRFDAIPKCRRIA